MSDRFDTLFEGLRGQRPPTPFAPATAVRRRGRQRANRQAVSIGVAVLAATGLSAGGVVAALGGQEEPPVLPADTTTATQPTPPTQAPPPVATEIPDSWLLTTADLPDTGWEESTGEFLEGEWYWDGAEPWCPEYRLEDYPSVGQQIDVRTRGWARQAEAERERVDQLVELFPAGVGAESIDDVRDFIQLCSREPSPGDQVAPTYYEIEETDFAGDESLLIGVLPYQFNDNNEIVPAGEQEHVVVIRVGDAVTTIRFLGVPDVQAISQRAAARLR